MESDEENSEVAVNKNCQNKSNPQLVARGWSNILTIIEYLLGWVKAGYGWCSTHFREKHRKADNAAGSNLIVLDFDGDTTLDASCVQTARTGVLLPTHLLVTQSRSTGSVLCSL